MVKLFLEVGETVLTARRLGLGVWLSVGQLFNWSFVSRQGVFLISRILGIVLVSIGIMTVVHMGYQADTFHMWMFGTRVQDWKLDF